MPESAQYRLHTVSTVDMTIFFSISMLTMPALSSCLRKFSDRAVVARCVGEGSSSASAEISGLFTVVVCGGRAFCDRYTSMSRKPAERLPRVGARFAHASASTASPPRWWPLSRCRAGLPVGP